ncbi:MAG: hypothetical protein KKH98_04440 [Spirochaetes bacterium]|nr:hypothetical protein [Spirochaetota bacterium]
MRKIILSVLFFFLCSNLYSLSYNIEGNHIIWSPVSESLFLYSVYGKSTGTTIWKVYDLKKKMGKTVYYGNSLLPQWSFDGKGIMFTKKNMMQMYSEEGELKEYATSVVDLLSFDWGVKGDKITYSNGEKIYVLEIENNNNYAVVDGESPSFMDNDKKILYFDKDLKVNLVDESLKSKILIDKSVKKVFPAKVKNMFFYQTEKDIDLYDLDSEAEYRIVEDENEISSFDVSYDHDFLTYINNKGDHFIVHIPTHLKIKMLSDKDYFAQKISSHNTLIAFEKSGAIEIKDVRSYLDTFKLENIFKISFGSTDGIIAGMSLEIYQEKKNPFTEKLIGYDEEGFKGAVKVIAVYKDHCFGMIDKEFSSEKTIEVGDAVLWKEKEKLARVLKK